MLSIPAKHISSEILKSFDTAEWRHASAVLTQDFPNEWEEIQSILLEFRFRKSQVFAEGGNMSSVAKSIHQRFSDFGWVEKKFKVAVLIDDEMRKADTHQIDHFKGRIAIETEWNSKDSVFDRDLKNFRQLHDHGAISVGVIITRADSLDPLFKSFGYDLGKKYGASTTHMSKLIEEVKSGTIGGCPLLMFGITKASYIEDEVPAEVLTKLQRIQDERKAKLKAKS